MNYTEAFEDYQEFIDEELIKLVGGCELCGSIPMTVNCNNANCDKGVL